MADLLECDVLRKCKSKENETSDQYQNHLAHDRDNKMKKRSAESAKERREYNEQITPSVTTKIESLNEFDHKLLQKFRNKINKFEHKLCSTCNECFPSIKLVLGECHHCYSDKNIPKKFSTENNMNLRDILKELQDLIEIEEMLITQIFLVISEYCLCGGQYAYKGNVINFFQDSASGPAFRDFNVRLVKIAKMLIWLKSNNWYYANIEIDNEALQSLPENGPIDNYLLQFLPDLIMKMIQLMMLLQECKPRALQEGRVYVKQSLNENKLTVKEVQEIIESNNHLADQVIRFGESLYGTRQFWNRRWLELSDMIKQLGSQGLIFFTFNLIDNPHIAAWFFENHFKSFLDDILIPK
ncbi:14889_t:CDS:2 [Cetraspora pellucida]|uniref:14889_t:CDS:1 n=1 Tax=Cetraspora pellucida TaxID=1433469 RepID=A0A9N9HSC8_9GLOM|nr:14889_t:CDS:2 [Cetraspora pellucida]